MAGDRDIVDAQARGARDLGFMSTRIVSVGLLLTALMGCGEEPNEPPQLTGFSPAIASVDANEAIKLRVVYEENDYGLESFQWTAEAGAIDGNGQSEITYTAPETPGDYKLTVTVAYADDAELSLENEVKVLSVDEAEWALAANPEALPVTSSVPTGSSAEPDDAVDINQKAMPGDEAALVARTGADAHARELTGSEHAVAWMRSSRSNSRRSRSLVTTAIGSASTST